jgi:muramoyltetrapeptide carboxypeptidase
MPARRRTKPRALKPGDLVAVAAPSSAVERDQVGRGVAELLSLGFRVRVPDDLYSRHFFTAGTVERRVAELHALFKDKEVAAIVCARGGAGAGRLLSQLDAEIIRANPKVFVGYSDVTALHLYLDSLGLVTFHGPMIAREFAGAVYDRAEFKSTVMGGAPLSTPDGHMVALRVGMAEGVVRGGCLSLLAAAAGTPWPLRTEGEDTILVLEDVDERPYRLDRMITQLRDSGALAGVRGIVFGVMKGCAPRQVDGYVLQDVLMAALEGLGGPVAMGLSTGHTDGRFVTVPLGVRARLTCGPGARLEVLEAAVS